MTFQELNLSAPLLRAVREAGYETPSPIQASAIPPVLAGRDLMGCAQTGTGKTAAFALPMLDRLAAAPPRKKGGIRALILTPTRELALQIGESFSAYGKYSRLRHTVIFGGVGQTPQVEALQKGVDILIACPGRLNDLVGQGFIDLSHIEIFVLDEADRMLDMGFVHDVKRVIAKLPAQRQNLMFSATMPTEIEQLAAGILRDPAFVKVDPVSSTVERIDQKLYFVEKSNKRFLLPWLIKNLDPPVQNALVFSRTKHGADKIARDLNREGITAAAIHGNKSQSARVAALEGFKAGKTQVLVATDIAARGIDINELSHVFNYDLPEVPETYVHRIGRTARAGADGTAVSFCAPEEQEYLAGIEKLNRRRIPVVAEHPWADVPAPAKAATQATPAAKPAKPEKPAPVKAAPAAKHPKQETNAAAKAASKPVAPRARQTLQAKEEPNTMDENQKRTGGRNENRRTNNRRTRQNGAAKTAADAAASNSTSTSAARGSNNAQPRFDPHFVSAPEQPPLRKKTQSAAPDTKAPEKAAASRRTEAQPRANTQNTARNDRSGRGSRLAQASSNAAPSAQPTQSTRTPRSRTRTAPVRDDDPGLVLISRRAPQQKFTNFEEYMAAHGGATAPIEDHSEEY